MSLLVRFLISTCESLVAHRSAPPFFADALKSAQISVVAIDLGGKVPLFILGLLGILFVTHYN